MTTEIPESISIPDKVETRLGTLEFFDGFPTDETVEKVLDFVDFHRGVDVFMDEMSAAISSAANEQSTVAEDINRGIVNISQVAEHTAEGAKKTSTAVETMTVLSAQLQEAASKFKV